MIRVHGHRSMTALTLGRFQVMNCWGWLAEPRVSLPSHCCTGTASQSALHPYHWLNHLCWLLSLLGEWNVSAAERTAACDPSFPSGRSPIIVDPRSLSQVAPLHHRVFCASIPLDPRAEWNRAESLPARIVPTLKETQSSGRKERWLLNRNKCIPAQFHASFN